ncbi:MAG: leucine-rich repeat protein [Muribaculaceae bacterium]|nr:leucine-rich repeat protein [Muribaculaceae bacterium]
MIHKLLLLLSVVGLSLKASSAVVETTPGTLCDNVDDMSITTLTLTGEMDARDFRFIADSLRQLTEIDLSGVNIVAFSDPRNPVFLTLTDYAAQSVPAMAFFDMQLTQVVLPASLKSIGMGAFAGCDQLATIELPATIDSIGSYAFNGSGLTSVNVPASVKYVGEGAFSNCQALTMANVEASVLGANLFKADEQLATVTLGPQVTDLGNGAFNGCYALASIVMPEGSALARVGDEAFIRSGLTTINLENLNSLSSVGEWAFAQSALEQIALPASLATIGQGAFYYAPSLVQLNMADAVDEIPAYMLAGTQGLALDTLPEGVRTIGDYAFYCNNQAARFYLPASVGFIGSYAMAGMTGLEYITSLATEVPALGSNVWEGVDQPAVKLEVASNEVADDYAAAEQWKEFYILRAYLLGDANNDGTVDVLDVTTIINYILGKNPDPFVFNAANVNGDAEVDVMDITLVINYILTNTTETVLRAKNHAVPVTTDGVEVKPFAVKPGAEVLVEARLNNTQTYTAMQFDLQLPEGLHVVDGSLETASSAQGHAIVSLPDANDNTLHMMIYSPSNAAIEGTGETLFTFKVRADERLASESTVKTSATLFVTTANEKYLGTDGLTAVSNATGIEDMTASNDKVYASGGILVIESTEGGAAQLVATNGMYTELTVAPGRNEWPVSGGIYIVRLNGKSYKVIVK